MANLFRRGLKRYLGGETIKKAPVVAAAVLAVMVIASAAVYFLVLRKPSGGENVAPSFTISVTPKSLSVAHGGSGTLTVTVSPAEYGSSIGAGLTFYGGVNPIENTSVQGGVGPNAFNYIFKVADNAPQVTYTVTLTVTTMVPSPWLTASENFTLTVT